MKLRNKVLIGIVCTWTIFLAITYAGSQYILIRSFLHLEQEHAAQDLRRINQALDQIDYSLYTFTSDWSHWNNFYDYMHGNNPAFIPNNINMTALINSTINLLTYWTKEGQILFGTSVDTDNGKYIAYPQGLDKYLYPGSYLVDRSDIKNDLRGYLLLPNGIMMVAACSATDGEKIQPPYGAMITGRYISPKIIQKIEDTTKLSIELFNEYQLVNNTSLREVFETISQNENGLISKPINENTLEGYTVIRDFNNKPIGMFRMTIPRTIYMTGQKAIHYYQTSFIVLGALFTLLMIGLLRVLIIKRLEKLDQDVAEISKKNALSQRVDVSGNDELSSVAKEINAMMDIIQSSHEQLEHRVEQRTQELQQTNVQLQQEITERKSVEKELILHKEHLIRLAHYDALTALPNRVLFNEILNKTLSHANRHNKLIAVLFIDLDRFKTINDALGHTIGDLVLKEIATRFSSTLRAGDVLARLGGDEFIILLNDIGYSKYAEPVAEKLLQICAKPVQIDNHEFFITTSIGICIYPDDGLSLEDLQRNADMAMYKAKKSGGSVYQYFTQEMNLEAHAHIQLEAALRKAIKNHEFILYYQPKYNLSDGLITGVEALIRWESPEYGLVSPATFIPLAEETGLILQIGEWAMREACRAAKSWQDNGYQPISVAVNLSPKQFKHQNIAKVVEVVLEETGLDSKYLELEITETAVMDNVDIAITRLNDIKKMGVQIAVDDFGTGYTSISYLKQYPVSVLKIDQSFIKGIPVSQNDISITTAVIALAHSLGMQVVAEGVETEEQLQYLADHDCDLVQGYYLSRPLPEAKLILQLTKLENVSATQ